MSVANLGQLGLRLYKTQLSQKSALRELKVFAYVLGG
jgi:hypothetical protein